MRRRGSGATHSRSPGDGGAPLAGTTTCRQELADRRGWSTFSEARPDQSLERRKWSAGRRVPPLRIGGTGRSQDAPLGWLRQPSIGSLASSRVCRRSAPLDGAKNCNSREGLPGADQRIRAMTHASPRTRAPCAEASASAARQSVKMNSQTGTLPDVRR